MCSRKSRLLHLIWMVACVGCGPTSVVHEVEAGPRADLWVQYARATVDGGLTDELVFDVPEDVVSLLFEVRGGAGIYSIAKLETPEGQDQVETGRLVTRDAREIPGVVSWMWPNRPWLRPQPGPHTLVIRGETASGQKVSGVELDVRLVMMRGNRDRCGVRLDIVAGTDAIDRASVDDLAAGVADTLRAADVELVDYTVRDAPAVTPRPVRDVAAAMLSPSDRLWLRHGAIPVLVTRSASPSTLRGYSLALPGPYSNRLENAAVAVFTERHASGGYLDVAALAATTTHELGHYLGLYHTSEPRGDLHDPIDDTPECPTALCSPEFAANIMSPGSDATERWFSAGQAAVIRRHPMCAPL